MADKKKDGENEETPELSYTSEQLHEAIEKARLEERTKLQEKIDQLEEQAKRPKAKAGDVDVAEAIREAVEAAKKGWEKDKNKELSKMQTQLNELSTENKSRKVQAWKAAAIEAYGGNVIAALIKGDTEEEIALSAEAAHQTWRETMENAGVEIVDEDESEEEEEEESEEESEEEAVNEEEEEVPLNGRHSKTFSKVAGVASAKIKKKSQPVTPKKSQVRVAALELPVVGERGGVRRNEPDAKLKNVRELPMSEYRKRRADILASVKQRYGSQ